MLAQVLSMPWVAVVLGFSLGVGLFLPLAWSSRLSANGNADVGLFVATGVVLGGLVAALVLMLGYRAVAPEGVVYFGVALVVGYMGVLGIYTVVSIRKLTGSKSHSTDETRG